MAMQRQAGRFHARRGRVRRTAAVLAAAALTLATPALVGVASAGAPAGARAAATTRSAGAAGPSMPEIVSRVPALPAGARPAGAVAAGRVIDGAVALAPQHAAALTAWATAVASPTSRSYRHYLTASEAARAFAPAPSTVAAVEGVLRADGLTASARGLLVDFRGSAARVEAAFHTGITAYRLVGGRQAYANTAAARLPATVAPSVLAVVGLNDLVVPRVTPLRHTVGGRARRAPSGASSPRIGGAPAACTTASSAAADLGGLTDGAIAHAYGADGLYGAGVTGRGETVAVYELEPYETSDIAAFDTCYFGASAAAAMLARLKTVPVDGGQAAGYGSGESVLDIQDVSALAPGATIDVYEAPPTNAGYLDELDAIVDDDRASVVTSSWGSGCETEVEASEPGLLQAENAIFEQAAVQGQSVLVAAGDSGSDGCAYRSAAPVAPVLSQSDPASQPYVTAVGGTTIEKASDPPVEQVWNDGAGAGAGGGGISAVWPAPAWQTHSGVPGVDARKVIAAAEGVAGNDFCQGATADPATPCREVPDVSAQADEYTGAVTIYYGGQWGTIGGTSSSTPLWAAMLADVDQSCGSSGGIGFADPSLYAVAGVPAEYKASFNDVTVADNDGLGAADGLFPATTGYDMATGLGTPKLTGPGGTHGLAYYLCHAAPGSARPTVTGIAPPVVSSAAGATTPLTLTVSGLGFTAGGTGDVAGVTIGTYDVPAADIHVASDTSLTVTVGSAAVQAGNPASGAGTSADGGGTYDVTVTRAGGLTSIPTTAARLVVYDDPKGTGTAVPVVAAVTPSGGAEVGGTTVRVYGSGFAVGSTPTVTFGGAAGTDVHVVSDRELTVTTPAYGGATTCLAADAHPTTDVCQTEVVVRTSTGTSATVPLDAEYQGELPAPVGTAGLTAGPTEYDYVPAPHVSSVVILAGSPITSPDVTVPTHASESGLTLAKVYGTGFGELGLQWVDVGTPALATSVDEEIVDLTSTSIELYLPNTRSTVEPENERLAVQTVASPNLDAQYSAREPSNVVIVPYAPTPRLSSVTTASGLRLGPVSGGTVLTLDGAAFVDDEYVQFLGASNPFGATEYNVHAVSSTELTLTTPPELPGDDEVLVCNDSGCSGSTTECSGGLCITTTGGSSNPKVYFTFYPPGAPSIRSISPRRGPVGTYVVISGTNLGFPQAVYFGTRKGIGPGNGFNGFSFLLDQVYVEVPPGKVGSTVEVRLSTAESVATRKQPLTPADKKLTFTYTKGTGGSIVLTGP